MNKLFMLAFANIRKTKGHTVSLLIMFFIAALLFNIGLLISLNFSNFFGKITKELVTSDIYYLIPDYLHNEQVEDYLTHHENVIELEKQEVHWAYAETEYDNTMRERVFLFSDAEIDRELSQWKFVGKHLPVDENSIYLPYLFQLSGGYELNDPIEFIFADTKLTFTIKGFIEDMYFSSPETGPMGAYLPHRTYEKVIAQLPDKSKAFLYFANLKIVNKDIETGIRNLIKQESTSFQNDMTSNMFGLDLPLVKMSRTIMANIVAVMVVAFAAIILLVCLIVVRFRINNSIEDDMVKIGSLKAIGYTSRQIIISILLQFIMIAFIGSIMGITVSYSTIPALSAVFAAQSGLKWIQGFDGFISMISLSVILLIVGIVAFVSARRIKKLHPIIALRGGIVTHSFRKNYVSLDQSKGALSLLFALKSILQNKKQSIMITVILVAVSFAQTFAVVMFYNTSIDTTAFLETPGIELSNALVVISPEQEQLPIVEEIKRLPEVRKVQYIDEVMVNIDGYEVNTYVMEDYSKKETVTVYEGRYPKHSNEIVLAGHLADMLGKTVGDRVEVRVGDNKLQFMITGLSQGAYMGGLNSSLTYDAMMKLNPGFVQKSLNVYLNKGEDAAEFISTLETTFGDALIYTVDVDESMELGAGAYVSIVSKVGIVILVITIAVVILVLYFVINSTVVRKRRELGIQKAMGFTTFQLMNQISLSLLPPIILGVILGSIIGMTQTNVIMSSAQSGMGIKEANFIITPISIALFGIAIIVLSYASSMLITYKIRKISAYALVSE